MLPKFPVKTGVQVPAKRMTGEQHCSGGSLNQNIHAIDETNTTLVSLLTIKGCERRKSQSQSTPTS